MKEIIPTFNTYLFERTAEEIPHKKNQWVEINKDDYDDLTDDFYKLIQTAYKEIGGNLQVAKPEDILNQEWNYWKAIDIDHKPDFEVIRAAKVTPFGHKSTVVGHDGSRDAKSAYMQSFVKDLKTRGEYVEVSHKLAEILINKYNVHVVINPDSVKKVLGKPLEWNGKHPTDSHMPGEGWYTRTIAGRPMTKIMVGRPVVQESANFDENKKTILVLHGLESPANPSRLDVLRKDYNIIADEMHYLTDSNIYSHTLDKIKKDKIDLIVGSSMGGYLGYYIAKKLNVPALFFNPALIETSSATKKPPVKIENGTPKMYIVIGSKDDVVNPDVLKTWLKDNGKNFEIFNENIGHRIPDNIYIDYVNKIANLI
jgi:hypothetical protein